MGAETGQKPGEDYGQRTTEAAYGPTMENSSKREWAQWIKCLPCKLENLSLVPIIHVKKKKVGVAAYDFPPGHWGEVR